NDVVCLGAIDEQLPLTVGDGGFQSCSDSYGLEYRIRFGVNHSHRTAVSIDDKNPVRHWVGDNAVCIRGGRELLDDLERLQIESCDRSCLAVVGESKPVFRRDTDSM